MASVVFRTPTSACAPVVTTALVSITRRVVVASSTRHVRDDRSRVRRPVRGSQLPESISSFVWNTRAESPPRRRRISLQIHAFRDDQHSSGSNDDAESPNPEDEVQSAKGEVANGGSDGDGDAETKELADLKKETQKLEGEGEKAESAWEEFVRTEGISAELESTLEARTMTLFEETLREWEEAKAEGKPAELESMLQAKMRALEKSNKELEGELDALKREGKELESQVETTLVGMESTLETTLSGLESEPEDRPDENWFQLLNLLVVTGGVKGSLAVVLGSFAGINAVALIHPDLQSTIHGLQFALPVAFLDALVMLPKWDGDGNAFLSDDTRGVSKSNKIKRALFGYQREEALANPCRSMPWFQDVLVAATARVTDEMLERAVVIGFLGKWLTDRLVETGFEPYEVEGNAKYAAVFFVYLYLEAKLRSSAKRMTQSVRAFRVERDTITGKQTMIPMDETEVERVMKGNKTGGDDGKKSSKGYDDASSDNASASETSWSLEDTDTNPVPFSIGKSGTAHENKNKKKAGQPGASPVGSLMFNNSVKQFFDGFRSRVTLVAQCLCFVTVDDSNLWAPIAGGLACDALFVLYQREAMARFFDAANVDQPKGRPPTEREIKKTQITLVRRDLERKRAAMASSLMDSVDNAPAGSTGAREINVLMRSVVSEVKAAKGFKKETDAVTFVLNEIHEKFPPDLLDEMSEQESVAAMRGVFESILVGVRGRGGKTKDLESDATRDRSDAELDAEMTKESTSSETASQDDTKIDKDDVLSASKKLDTSVGSRPVSLTDLASLARSNEAAPPESIWEAARKELGEEKKVEEPKEKKKYAASNFAKDKDLEVSEPLRGVNSTWDALDALTNAVSEKLAKENEGK